MRATVIPGAPCKDCTERHLGCHDVERCEKWAAYVEKKKAAKAAMDEEAEKRAEDSRHYGRYRYPNGKRRERKRR